MDTATSRVPYSKRADRAIFEQIDKFKTTPNYTALMDFYGNLDEEQQKLFKGGTLLVLILLPVIVLSVLFFQNQKVREEYELRMSIMTRAQQIIGESRGVTSIGPAIISQNPIDDESMLTSRVANAVAGTGMDTSKISRGEFSTNNISEKILQTEAELSFNNVSNDELVNLFSNLISREKMRISEVTVNRNADTNLLSGRFRVIHLSAIQTSEVE